LFVNGVDARAAGSLTGTTLNATVVNSSLTSVGTLGSLAVTGAITNGSQVVGAAAGGNQGAGTLNATGLFVNGVAAAYEYRAVKAASLGRASTTLTADPDLAFASVAVGTYSLESLLQFWGTTTGTQGIQYDFLSGTATLSGNSTWMTAGGRLGSGGSDIQSGINFSGNNAIATITVSTAASDYVFIMGTIIVTVAGSFQLRWAQNTGSANNTNLAAGSSMRLRKLA
jgi:hypothetical protein